MKKKSLLSILFLIAFVFSKSQNILQQTLAFDNVKKKENGTDFERHVSHNFVRRFGKKSVDKSKTAIDSIPDNTFLDFVGNGDIQQSLSQGQPLNANTGLGVILERFYSNNNIIRSFSIEGQINIATTADTIKSQIDPLTNVLLNRRDFGSYILNPTSSKQAIIMGSDVYFREHLTRGVISGANFRLVASNNIWVYGDSSRNLGAAALRIGFFHDFVPEEKRFAKTGQLKYSLVLGCSATSRFIFGDITIPESDTFRVKSLGNPEKRFFGWEWFVRIRLNNLIAEFDAPVMGTKGASIEGLNNTQFVFSIRFVGGFGVKLSD